MGSRSYGRRALSHADALARLDALDKLTADDVARLETEPGEVSIRGEGVRRDYDVVLKDGTKIELKNWPTWGDDAAMKLGDQFVRDIILGRYDPATLRSHRYVFREPAAKTVAEIRSFLRAALVRHLNEQVAANKITADQSGAMLDAFDREAGLVVISSARYTGAPMIPAVAVPVIRLPPPVPDDKRGRQSVPVPPATGP